MDDAPVDDAPVDDAAQPHDGTDHAVVHAGDASTVVGLGNPDDRAELLATVVAEAVTSCPNEVVVDLGGVARVQDVAAPLRRALRSVQAWPHPPVVVVARHPHAAQALDRLGATCVDLVPTLPVARVALTARPWADSRRVRLRTPLVSRAMVLAELVEFLRTHDRARYRAEAATVVVDELVGCALDADAREVELRLAVDDRRLGVAASWYSDDRSPDPDRALLAAMTDGYGVHEEPLATPGWATLAWAGITLRSPEWEAALAS